MINEPKEGTLIKIKNMGVLWTGVVKNIYTHHNPKYPNLGYAPHLRNRRIERRTESTSISIRLELLQRQLAGVES